MPTMQMRHNALYDSIRCQRRAGRDAPEARRLASSAYLRFSNISREIA